ncbi:hypothetical protein PDESU_01474 [Pontiella desulfatans]|uniref:Uncharacterized protein n=2 Tax=Pontiella desulfatans TaxID=2750659 RepID=A0A6C2TZ09_PONDE|nr:hypothetical protein PDESU_01474 [Pontiella desulfatans]
MMNKKMIAGIMMGSCLGVVSITSAVSVLSNEVHELNMEYSRDFGSAGDSSDDDYWYDIEAVTSHDVVSMRVQTLGGLDVLETIPWDSGSGLEWRISDRNQTTPYDTLLDGVITITFGFSDGSYQSTTLPFTQNDGVTPIPPMTVEPTFTSPSPLAGSIQTVGTLNLQWPTPQAGANFNEIGNALKDDDEDGVFIGLYSSGVADNLGWFPPSDGPITTTQTSVQLEQGFNVFAQYQGFLRTDLNADGIPYFYNKLAEVTHEFFVSGPTAFYDDFNDNSVDSAKWQPFIWTDPAATFTEVSGRLEYSNLSGSDGWHGWQWDAHELSSTQSWSVAVSAAFLNDIQNVGPGLSVFGGGKEFSIRYFNNGFDVYRLETWGIDLISDTDFYEDQDYFYELNDALIRIDYDATAQTLSSHAFVFGRFQQLSSISTASWGLSTADTFVPVIYVDNQGEVVSAGDLAFDNFMIWWDGEAQGGSFVDGDGDGLPDEWEIQYFGSTNHPNANPDADPDADGPGYGGPGRNWAEWIMGTDPTNASSILKLAKPWEIPGEGYVIDWQSVSGRVYTVEWTDSLTNSFQTLETGIAYPQNSYTDTVHSAESGGFYNLKVELEN